MKVKLAQHIYGNVEAEQSPRKIGGFQTLFYTQSLITEEESSEIEGRVIYHQSKNNPMKYVFFSLDNGNAAISRMVPLADSDRFGREGTYLGHSLIMTAKDFDSIGANPFILFQAMANRFLDNVSSALDAGDRSHGDIGVLELDIPENTEPPGMEGWNRDELLKLAYFAVHCHRTRANRNPLVLVGKPEEMLAALALIYTFVPYNWRRQCNFDTHYIDCNLVHGDFWCVGYPDAAGAPSHLTLVQLDTKKVTGNVTAPENLYEQWVQDCIRKDISQDISTFGEAAHEWMLFLTNSRPNTGVLENSLSDLPEDFFSSLNRTYEAPLLDKTRQMLSTMVGPLLTARLLRHNEAYPLSLRKSDVRKFFSQLFRGFDMDKLADQCFNLLKPGLNRKANRKELKEIKALYQKTAHKPLELLSDVWQLDKEDLTDHLKGMDEDPSLFSSLLRELDKSRLKVIKKLVKKLKKPVPQEFSDLLYQLLPDKKKGGFLRKLVRKLPFVKK